ncbi:coiled-coil domain-containing protein 172 isoform X2 [Nerophis ophidion]|uniref:coiled-coil domain-containing protein 172 isoform X2 n=1 Tax=Nerophis ophidion TaxID=159077 RepID=UPI002ADFDC1E|nr:coiled-coil domain-containing protein 172 isoform X2 [Nerophis ophidion]
MEGRERRASPTSSTMSLDKLFHQILLTEQQLTEQNQKLKEVKAAIVRCNGELKAATEKYDKTSEELDMKEQQLSSMRLQRDLMNKCEEEMSKHTEELLGQKSHLKERLDKIRAEFQDEESVFLQEVFTFNGDFSLGGSRETVLTSQTHTEVLNLDRQVDLFHKEMEEMSQRNSHMSILNGQRRTLQLELQALKNMHTDIQQQLSRAEEKTQALLAERHLVSQKHLTDSTCVRMRKEIEEHKRGEVELQREALSSELHLLQSKMDSQQGDEQQ